mmetsp:Transcript_40408/g.129739  ORF Transcript_40408/g.129739 Transcript_40408/m.129739 type:complete len:246 (-) Transcript_40408:2789-3526(-)
MQQSMQHQRQSTEIRNVSEIIENPAPACGKRSAQVRGKVLLLHTDGGLFDNLDPFLNGHIRKNQKRMMGHDQGHLWGQQHELLRHARRVPQLREDVHGETAELGDPIEGVLRSLELRDAQQTHLVWSLVSRLALSILALFLFAEFVVIYRRFLFLFLIPGTLAFLLLRILVFDRRACLVFDLFLVLLGRKLHALLLCLFVGTGRAVGLLLFSLLPRAPLRARASLPPVRPPLLRASGLAPLAQRL